MKINVIENTFIHEFSKQNPVLSNDFSCFNHQQQATIICSFSVTNGFNKKKILYENSKTQKV